MDHLACELNVDSLELRLFNMKPGTTEVNLVPTVVDSLKMSSEFEKRKGEIEAFNAANKWKKRGISIVPMAYPQGSGGATFYFQLAIYAEDGSIAITCGAVELGQVMINLSLSQISSSCYIVKLLGDQH